MSCTWVFKSSYFHYLLCSVSSVTYRFFPEETPQYMWNKEDGLFINTVFSTDSSTVLNAKCHGVMAALILHIYSVPCLTLAILTGFLWFYSVSSCKWGNSSLKWPTTASFYIISSNLLLHHCIIYTVDKVLKKPVLNLTVWKMDTANFVEVWWC
jgi:hypothetical protein